MTVEPINEHVTDEDLDDVAAGGLSDALGLTGSGTARLTGMPATGPDSPICPPGQHDEGQSICGV